MHRFRVRACRNLLFIVFIGNFLLKQRKAPFRQLYERFEERLQTCCLRTTMRPQNMEDWVHHIVIRQPNRL